jgi:hypothetical protein
VLFRSASKLDVLRANQTYEAALAQFKQDKGTWDNYHKLLDLFNNYDAAVKAWAKHDSTKKARDSYLAQVDALKTYTPAQKLELQQKAGYDNAVNEYEEVLAEYKTKAEEHKQARQKFEEDAKKYTKEQADLKDFTDLGAKRDEAVSKFDSDVKGYKVTLGKHEEYKGRENARDDWDKADTAVKKYDTQVDGAKKYTKYVGEKKVHDNNVKQEVARKDKWTEDSTGWKTGKTNEEARYAKDMKQANVDYQGAKSTYDTKLGDAKTLHAKNTTAQQGKINAFDKAKAIDQARVGQETKDAKANFTSDHEQWTDDSNQYNTAKGEYKKYVTDQTKKQGDFDTKVKEAKQKIADAQTKRDNEVAKYATAKSTHEENTTIELAAKTSYDKNYTQVEQDRADYLAIEKKYRAAVAAAESKAKAEYLNDKTAWDKKSAEYTAQKSLYTKNKGARDTVRAEYDTFQKAAAEYATANETWQKQAADVKNRIADDNAQHAAFDKQTVERLAEQNEWIQGRVAAKAQYDKDLQAYLAAQQAYKQAKLEVEALQKKYDADSKAYANAMAAALAKYDTAMKTWQAKDKAATDAKANYDGLVAARTALISKWDIATQAYLDAKKLADAKISRLRMSTRSPSPPTTPSWPSTRPWCRRSRHSKKHSIYIRMQKMHTTRLSPSTRPRKRWSMGILRRTTRGRVTSRPTRRKWRTPSRLG